MLVIVVLLGVGTVGGVLAGFGEWTQRAPLDPESAGPDGARALARTLAAHGVEVSVVRSLTDAEAVGGTLVVGDTAPLSDDQVDRLADRGDDVVFVEPGARDARVLFGADTAGFGSTEPVPADCALAAAERAGAVAVGALFTAGTASTACYPVDDGFGLLLRERDGGRVALLDGTLLFPNAQLTADGNAALGLNLLGRNDHVVWFVPSLADAEPGDAASLGELTPAWVTPAILLLVAAAAAAALWRGRRFGPLVTERLPVSVRAGETTRGRALLYARSRDAAHAGALLRSGAHRRLARRLALVGAPVDLVVARLATRLQRDETSVLAALAGPPPRGDRELAQLAAALDELEAALAAALEGES